MHSQRHLQIFISVQAKTKQNYLLYEAFNGMWPVGNL